MSINDHPSNMAKTIRRLREENERLTQQRDDWITVEKKSLTSRLAQARHSIDFAVGAIADAIYTEDGLDGEAGERILMILTEWIKYGTFDTNKVERDEMLTILNLRALEEPR